MLGVKYDGLICLSFFAAVQTSVRILRINCYLLFCLWQRNFGVHAALSETETGIQPYDRSLLRLSGRH